jgi:hypothetical protein
MRKALFFFLALPILITTLASCRIESGSPLTEQMPSDFNFSISFGIGRKNKIDTYEGTFTKDLIIDGTETISFLIQADKMREMYEAFIELEIYKLPDDINADTPIGDTALHITPDAQYSLTYTLNSETKTVSCDDGGPWNADGLPETRDRLVEFIDFVSEYIYGTEEYKNMKPAEGGYQ